MTIEIRPETHISDECEVTLKLRSTGYRGKLTAREWERLIYSRIDGIDEIDLVGPESVKAVLK